MEIVSQRLKELRTNLNLSQMKISKLLDLAQASIYRYENDQAEAPYEVLLWYADYFDVSMDYIFGRTDKPEGKLYKYQPRKIKEALAKQNDWKEFVEFCFDPRSPMYDKLKELMINMAGSEK